MKNKIKSILTFSTVLMSVWRHDILYNDTQHNDIQPKRQKLNLSIKNTQRNTYTELSIMTLGANVIKLFMAKLRIYLRS
jgi:hypothetical protein